MNQKISHPAKPTPTGKHKKMRRNRFTLALVTIAGQTIGAVTSLAAIQAAQNIQPANPGYCVTRDATLSPSAN